MKFRALTTQLTMAVFAILTLTVSCVEAAETWAKVYDGFTTSSIQQTSDGGYVISGSAILGAGVIKTDSNGETEWSRTIQNVVGGGIAKQTNDGGYLYATDTNVSFSTSRWDLVVVKFDQFGNILWQRTVGTDKHEYFSDLALTADGGFLLLGSYYNESYFGNCLVIKADQEGNIEWQKQYNLKTYDNGRSIAQTADGGIIVAGDAFTPGQSTDAFVLRLDNFGNPLWRKAYCGTGATDSVSVKNLSVTQDGGYILASYSNNTAILHRIDINGNLVWQKSYIQTDPSHLGIDGIDATYDSTGGHSGYVFSGSNSTVKIDVDGNIQWQKPYGYKLFDVTSDRGLLISAASGQINNILKMNEYGEVLDCQLSFPGSDDVTQATLDVPEKNIYLSYFDATNTSTISTYAESSITILPYSACQETLPAVLTVTKAGAGQGNVTPDLGILTWSGSGTTGTANYSKDTLVTLTAAPSLGSVLTGWSGGGCSGTADCTVTLSEDTNVAATFGLTSFIVTPSAGANGSLSPSAPRTVYYNQTTWFTVTPNTGYTIGSVSGCGGNLSGSTYITGPISADCTVTASFIPLYTLTVILSGNGTGTVHSLPTPDINCTAGTCGQEYGSGTLVTLTATPNSGNSFDRWGGACNGVVGTTCQVTMDAAKSVDARFKSK